MPQPGLGCVSVPAQPFGLGGQGGDPRVGKPAVPPEPAVHGLLALDDDELPGGEPVQRTVEGAGPQHDIADGQRLDRTDDAEAWFWIAVKAAGWWAFCGGSKVTVTGNERREPRTRHEFLKWAALPAERPSAMRKFWISVSAAFALAMGGSSAGIPPTAEILDAQRLVARGDPAAPRGGLVMRFFSVVPTDSNEQCTPFPAPAQIPATARLGEPIAYHGARYTVRSIGVADQGRERVWLVARVEVAHPRCPGSGSVWEFLFTTAGGTIYQPTPQGRRGEFTLYEIPAGGWATGLVFFDLPTTDVTGGAVGFRKPPFATSFTNPAPTRPYGLWPVPASPPAVRAPHAYPFP
ncbi:hypothetical protein Ari01nite_96150 [Paractinoplanes rishiriensis]|uniref:Uncharacterized protein n=1 Tax=Paractinoplanes rishiriensis TaxID=1050105 RepID=A0A919K721_9ACTN|nr:hypothetical protein Ari01nite_96150 [Actinoplanes rishiriensis]